MMAEAWVWVFTRWEENPSGFPRDGEHYFPPAPPVGRRIQLYACLITVFHLAGAAFRMSLK